MLILLLLLSILPVYDALCMEEGEESEPTAQICALHGLRRISPDNQAFLYFSDGNEDDEESSTLNELMTLSRQVRNNLFHLSHEDQIRTPKKELKREKHKGGTNEKENDDEPLSYSDFVDELKLTIYYSLMPSSIKTTKDFLQLLKDIYSWATVDTKNYGLIYSELLTNKAKLIHLIESWDLKDAKDAKNDIQILEKSEIFSFMQKDIKNIIHLCGKLKFTPNDDAPCGVIRDLMSVGLNHRVKINNQGLPSYLDFQLEPGLAIELLENGATLENFPDDKAFMHISCWSQPGIFMHISYEKMAGAMFGEAEREEFKKLFVLLINNGLNANYRFDYGGISRPVRAMKVPLLGIACEAFNYDLALIELSLQHGADPNVQYISPILGRQINLFDHVRASGKQEAIELFEKYENGNANN